MASKSVARVKPPEELRDETEFYRRSSFPYCEKRYLGSNTWVLDCLGHDLGTRTALTKRGKEVAVHYVLPSLAKYETYLRMPVAGGGGAKARPSGGRSSRVRSGGGAYAAQQSPRTPKAGETIKIGGVTYIIERARPFEHAGEARVEFELRRPLGRRKYFVVLYPDGLLSEVV